MTASACQLLAAGACRGASCSCRLPAKTPGRRILCRCNASLPHLRFDIQISAACIRRVRLRKVERTRRRAEERNLRRQPCSARRFTRAYHLLCYVHSVASSLQGRHSSSLAWSHQLQLLLLLHHALLASWLCAMSKCRLCAGAASISHAQGVTAHLPACVRTSRSTSPSDPPRPPGRSTRLRHLVQYRRYMAHDEKMHVCV